MGSAPNIKMIAAARRRPGMTHGEFIAYIRDVHGALSRAQPNGLARYVQNHVFDGAFGADGDARYEGVFHRDSVTELYFASFEDLERCFSADYTRTVIAPDGANFAELPSNLSFLAAETVIDEPREGNAKILLFLHPAPEADAGASSAAWREAHKTALLKAPLFAKALHGLSISARLDPPVGAERRAAHFGGATEAPPALMISYRVSESDLPLFRPYRQALFANAAFDPHRSFFLFAQPLEIL